MDKLKAITGQDPIRYERKNQQQGPSFSPSCLVMIAANEMIQSSDYTSGLERRRLTILFDNQPLTPDRMLQSKLKKELPGILNWALGLTDEQVETIVTDPASVAPSAGQMKLQMLLDTNPLIAWTHSNLVLDREAKTNVGVKKMWNGDYQNTSDWLYANYLEWCNGQNKKPLSTVRFSNDLKDVFKSQLKLQVDKHTGRRGAYFSGIRIRTSQDDFLESPVTKRNLNRDTIECDGLVMGCDGLPTSKNITISNRSDGCDEGDGLFKLSKKSLNDISGEVSNDDIACNNLKVVINPSPSSHPSHHVVFKGKNPITLPITPITNPSPKISSGKNYVYRRSPSRVNSIFRRANGKW